MSAAPDQVVGATGRAAAIVVDRVGRFVFRYRDYLAPAGLALILLVTRPENLFASRAANNAADLVGLVIAALGQAVRVSVIGYAYIVRGGSGKSLAAPTLVCQGIYAHSRNPMYVGNFLLLTGLAIIYNSRWVYALGLPLFIGGLLSIIRAEENFLRQKFGAEYDDYCRRVNRFWPQLASLRATVTPMRFDWRRVLRKEYGTTFAWMSAAIFLLAWERWIHFGYRAEAATFHRLLFAWGLVVFAYGVARWLKKTGRLDSPSV
jgi:protein-S-isoprenylcysteine O-methyltransferase Ste14